MKTAKVRSCSFDKKTGRRTVLDGSVGETEHERVEEIDLDDNMLFNGLADPLSIAEKYESYWNDIGNSRVIIRVVEVIIE